MHKEEEESRYLHLYCGLFVQWGPWFTLDNLYGRYYTDTRGGFGHGRSDADADANADADPDEKGEERERGDVGEEE